jgi:hypothetical protein
MAKESKAKQQPKGKDLAKNQLPSLTFPVIFCAVLLSAVHFAPPFPSLHELYLGGGRASTKPFTSFEDFYPFYKSEHGDRTNRILHFW